jgi:hypothetical protein
MMNPILKERFAEAKGELRDFTISEAKYLQLKSLPEDQLSFKDYVLVKVHEMHNKYQSQTEQLRRQLEDYR